MTFKKPLIGSALLLISMSISANTHVARHSSARLPEVTEAAIEENTQVQLAERTLNQLRALDHTLEDIGLAVNCKVAKIEDREAVAQHILELRGILVRYLGTHGPAIRSGRVEASTLQTLLDVESGMLTYLKNAVDDGFTSMDSFDEGLLVKRSRLDAELDVQEVEKLLDVLAEQIRQLDKAIKHIGYSTLNRFSRTISWVDKKTKLSKGFKRALPYIGLGVYLAWAMDQLPELPEWGPLKRLKDSFKNDRYGGANGWISG